MSDLKTQFEAAVANSRNLPKRPDNNTLLEMYSLYKQATDGDVSGKRPGMLDPVGRAKYDAWAKLKGTDSNTAMQTYTDLVTKLQGN